MRAMTSRAGPIARARRVAAEDESRLLADLIRSRQAAGLSREEVARRCGMSRSSVERLERGRRRGSLEQLACLGAAVGLDVRIRAYPAGDPIRDAGQQRLLERLRRQIHPALRWRTEVPLPDRRDLRAWDAVVAGSGWFVAIEAETVLLDVQAVERRIDLKWRDGGADQLVLLVSDTRRNRRAIAAAPAAFASLPGRARDVLPALRSGGRPPSGIVML